MPLCCPYSKECSGVVSRRAPPDHHDCLGGALAGPETLSDKGDDSRDRYDHSGFVGDNDDDVEEAGHVTFDLTGHDTAAAGGLEQRVLIKTTLPLKSWPAIPC